MNNNLVKFEFKFDNNKKHEINSICDSIVHTKKSLPEHLPKALLFNFIERLP